MSKSGLIYRKSEKLHKTGFGSEYRGIPFLYFLYLLFSVSRNVHLSLCFSDALLSYKSQGEAIATLKNMKECHLGGQKLTISPTAKKSSIKSPAGKQHNQHLKQSQNMQPTTNKGIYKDSLILC
jgi:hypothetical protein